MIIMFTFVFVRVDRLLDLNNYHLTYVTVKHPGLNIQCRGYKHQSKLFDSIEDMNISMPMHVTHCDPLRERCVLGSIVQRGIILYTNIITVALV